MKPTNKKGRPKATNPKTASLHLRLTPQEKEKIENVASMYSTTSTNVILMGIDLLEEKAQKK